MFLVVIKKYQNLILKILNLNIDSNIIIHIIKTIYIYK